MIDPRLVFLERAAARLVLIEAGELSADDAFAGLVPAIYEFADCCCYREILENFDEPQRDMGDDHRRDGHDHEDAVCHGRPAASTVEALKFELRTYGIEQLKESRTKGRIAELNVEQVGEVIAALRRMQPACPHITDELVELLQQVPK